MAVPIQKRSVTVDEYHRMAEEGAFPPEARLELIRGEIVEMSPIGPGHAGSVRRFIRNFSARLSAHALVDAQNPLLPRGQESEPQPDITLLRLRDDFYSTATGTRGYPSGGRGGRVLPLLRPQGEDVPLRGSGSSRGLAGRSEYGHDPRPPAAVPRRVSGRAPTSSR